MIKSQTFNIFSRLPLELQTEIWQAALKPPAVQFFEVLWETRAGENPELNDFPTWIGDNAKLASYDFRRSKPRLEPIAFPSTYTSLNRRPLPQFAIDLSISLLAREISLTCHAARDAVNLLYRGTESQYTQIQCLTGRSVDGSLPSANPGEASGSRVFINTASDLLCLQLPEQLPDRGLFDSQFCPELRDQVRVAIEWQNWAPDCPECDSLREICTLKWGVALDIAGPTKQNLLRRMIREIDNTGQGIDWGYDYYHDDSHRVNGFRNGYFGFIFQGFPNLEFFYIIDYNIKLLEGRRPSDDAEVFYGQNHNLIEVIPDDGVWEFTAPSLRSKPASFDFAQWMGERFIYPSSQELHQAVGNYQEELKNATNKSKAMGKKEVRCKVLACVKL